MSIIWPDRPLGDEDRTASVAHSRFRAMMLSKAYTCVGGASAVRRGDYRFAMLPELASPEGVGECGRLLRGFVGEFPEDRHPVAVLVAAFRGPFHESEEAFENALWRQLQGLHEMGSQGEWWDPATPLAERDDSLGFLFEDRNFFVVGLHPAASRWSRRYAWPTLVFNALSHADAVGQFERMRDRIRTRDERLQGSLSPTLDLPQVAQFSGRAVGRDWQCPLRPRGRGAAS